MDELENWCQERLVGDLCKYEAQQGGTMAIMCFGNQSCQRPPTSSLTLEELQ